MTQTRQKSLLESITNTLAGIAVSFIIQLIIYPILAIPVRIEQNIILTIVFTLASLIRSYAIRRIFNRL